MANQCSHVNSRYSPLLIEGPWKRVFSYCQFKIFLTVLSVLIICVSCCFCWLNACDFSRCWIQWVSQAADYMARQKISSPKLLESYKTKWSDRPGFSPRSPLSVTTIFSSVSSNWIPCEYLARETECYRGSNCICFFKIIKGRGKWLARMESNFSSLSKRGQIRPYCGREPLK